MGCFCFHGQALVFSVEFLLLKVWSLGCFYGWGFSASDQKNEKNQSAIGMSKAIQERRLKKHNDCVV